MIVWNRHSLVAVLCLGLSAGAGPASAAPARAAGKEASAGQTEAGRPARGRRGAAKGARAAEPAPQDEAAAAAAAREQVAARVAELEAVQSIEASARWLSGQAWDSQDPFIHLMAARTWLKVQTTAPSLDRAAFHAQEAVSLADAPPVLRISPAEVARVREEAARVQATVAWRRAEIRRARAERQAGELRVRRGRQEVVAGGALLLVSALGGGVALAGSAYRRRFDDIVAPLREAELPVDVAALRRLDIQGSRMVVGGAVVTLVGAAAGLPLLVLGARDLRLGKRQRERAASLRLQPTPGGIGLAGRF